MKSPNIGFSCRAITIFVLVLTVSATMILGSSFSAALASSSTAVVQSSPDFDGDGQADLAIGVPGEDVGSDLEAGAVNVLYGSSSGLTSSGDQFWTQDSQGIEDEAEGLQDDEGEAFGSTLAARDFDSDGFADLAIGVPNESIGDKFEVGAVNVIFGSSSGLTASGDQFWTRDSPGVEGTAIEFLHFGRTLGTGDFNGDESTDLAIGTPTDIVGDISDAGSVNVLYGSNSVGLASNNDQLWNQDSSGILDTAQEFDNFGASLSNEEAAGQ
jgi:hypothetical protein